MVGLQGFLNRYQDAVEIDLVGAGHLIETPNSRATAREDLDRPPPCYSTPSARHGHAMKAIHAFVEKDEPKGPRRWRTRAQ